ncbi:Hypothetical protein PHPALM_15695 [Phytophthora palmivora]|uniref:Uncharacterized protein n=1 Tax=Phytophthora palmivora TaxID=4796 RepID=A0A2P4XRI8_9STRA|nr:Hypothetical protein PHPALM_15695 [Phytophthora palmivora]
MCPQLIETVCAGYPQLGRLREIAVECIRVHVCDSLGPQTHRPSTHGSARTRLNVLRKNICKQQDAWRCLALNRGILALWSDIFISPFGVVNKSDGDPELCERTIHDLPYPKGASINDHVNHGTIPRPVYIHCDAIAKEIIRVSEAYPGSTVEPMAGDVTSAFRNLGIHSGSDHWFAGVIEEDSGLEVVGGAISYVHGSHTNTVNQSEVFNYHWVDDHVYVAAAIGSNCTDMERSLRFAMTAVLGAGAVNEDKFTVAMPTAKVEKARGIVASVYHAKSLSCRTYR